MVSFELNFKNIFILILILIIVICSSFNFIKEGLYLYDGTIKTDNLKNPNYNLNNKKIAICLSGQIRNGYEECLFLYNTFIINPLNADVFCCFEECDDVIKQFIINALKPKKIKYVLNYVKDENNVINVGTLSMYNKIYLVNQLKKEYETENKFIYDYVIRARPDLVIKEYLPKYIFDNNLNKLYLPLTEPITSVWGYPDFMAIGNSNIVDIYSDIFIYFTTNLNNKCNVPETLVYKYLIGKNIDCDVIKYPIILYRHKYDNIENFIECMRYTLSLTDRYVINNTC